MVALLALPSSKVSADSAAGQAKSTPCMTCHGQRGIANMVEAPNLAGQNAIYLELQLRHFRNGTRQHEIMNLMAKPLTDADISDLAEWYQSIKVSVPTD
jgi:cytochrome c553